MATGREVKLSQAYKQKCTAERWTIQGTLMKQLQTDLQRLLVEDMHSDITLQLKGRQLGLHKLVLTARCGGLADRLMEVCDHPETWTSNYSDGEWTDIEHLLRVVYRQDDLTQVLKKLHHYLHPQTPRTQREGVSPVGLDTEPGTCQNNGTLIQTNGGSVRQTGTLEKGTDSAAIDETEIGNVSEKDVLEPSSSETEVTDEHGTSLAGTQHANQSSHSELLETQSAVTGDARPSDDLSVTSGDTGSESCDRTVENGSEESVAAASNIPGGTLAGDRVSSSELQECDDRHENGVCVCDSQSGERTAPSYQGIDPYTVPETDCHLNTSAYVANGNRVSISSLVEEVYGLTVDVDPCSRLGEDLLRALLQEKHCDCVLQVAGKRFPAHKCILSARSSYFEAMLSGSWRESEAEELVLEGVSPEVMKQTLLYLYGGVARIDNSCSIGGLVMMADMYGMDGLKDVLCSHLRMNRCHFFHKPCRDCIPGVLESLTLTMMYNLPDMKEKCVKWVNKNFDKVWPTKSFAFLPLEVLEYCSTSAVSDLTVGTVLDTMLTCKQLNDRVPHLKWTEPVFDMITCLMDAAIEFCGHHFTELVSGDTFSRIDKKGIGFTRGPLEEVFSLVIASLSPEEACQSHLALQRWVTYFDKLKEDERPRKAAPSYTQEFEEFVRALDKTCKEHLCLYIHQAANTVEWGLLTQDMQRQLMQDANYVYIDQPNRSRVAPPKLTSMKKKISATSPLSLKEYFERHFGRRDNPPDSESTAKRGGTGIPKSTGKQPPESSTKRGGIPRLTGKTPQETAVRQPGTAGRQAPARSQGAKGGNSGVPGRQSSGASATSTKSKAKAGKAALTMVKSSAAKDSLLPEQGDSSSRETPSNSKQQQRSSSRTRSGLAPSLFRPGSSQTKASQGAPASKNSVKNGEPDLSKGTKEVSATGNAAVAAGSRVAPVVGGIPGRSTSVENLAEPSAVTEPGSPRDGGARQRSLSIGGSVMSPQVEREPRMQAAQSVGSFFSPASGRAPSAPPKLLPTLDVKFTIPHEFYESF